MIDNADFWLPILDAFLLGAAIGVTVGIVKGDRLGRGYWHDYWKSYWYWRLNNARRER
jgi:hypothetical protein